MKRTMSKRNIAKARKFAEKGMKMSDISKHLKIEEETLKQFLSTSKKKAVASTDK